MNGGFLLLALALCLMALAFVVIPLLHAPPDAASLDGRAPPLAMHRERLDELDRDLAAGTLTRAQHATALAELERELLDTIVVAPVLRRRVGRHASSIAAFTSVVVLPFLAVSIYLTVGHAEEVFATQASAGTPAPLFEAEPPSEAALRREFEHLAQQLQGRLAREPNDLESWVLLGRTLVFLNDLIAAERAFREAMVHGGERNPDLLARYADVLAERQGSLTGEPQRLIERALAIDPEHVQGLWLAGSLAVQLADEAAARGYWQRLLGVLPPDSREAEAIRGNLAQLDRAAAE
ncbi:c-type cytochrome biogenesis protein CcmI [Billgrantia pellis]|uniref:C-type cytochrome biogenesis protein CcmI n=1 Tax=Billgrantia pellis TaxID=2606936 RepID=A0A7V7KG67_9GAMM|nr:c-type cytochrome biogenesis protein CcmI [Halomonas pellis]KAA0010279.1 c-type cytochrome biogenesis protein CcmI [Halomonas pellis]